MIKDFFLFIIYCCIIVIVSFYAYQEGSFNGMKEICKDQDVGFDKRTLEYKCYDKEELSIFNNLGFNYGINKT